MNKKLVVFTGITLGLVLILISFASAFAVSSKYWEDKALELYPGQSETVVITLQNMAGDKDITVQAIMVQPNGVAEFLASSNIYSVPLGTKAQVDVLVTVPEGAVVGQKYSVILGFKVVDTSDSKSLGIGSSVEKIIPVVVVPKPVVEKEGVSPWVYLIVVLVVLIIAFVLWKVFSKGSKKK